MVETIEQQIINSINLRWVKNKKLRKEIDIDKMTNNFRMICSSRASILTMINNIREKNRIEDSIYKIEENIKSIFDWITEDTIESIIEKYNRKLIDKKKEAEYKAEIPNIKNELENLKETVIEITLNKLMDFHDVSIG